MADTAKSQSLTFSQLWEIGYKSLVPIIPPEAPISPRSSLHKRIGTSQDGRGKTPGVKGRDGNWFSFNWAPHTADEADLVRWDAMGAGRGIKTGLQPDGTWLVPIDADAPNEDHARIIKETVEEHFGASLPVRVGRHPKALYLIRSADEYSYTRVEFGARDAKGNCDRVEILAAGRQAVGFGVHPKTGRPYHWPVPIVPYEEVPITTAAKLDAFMVDLTQRLPQAEQKIIKEGATTDINQKTLKGDLETVRKAVALTPNTSKHFPTRESYRDMGYAIKAALPDHPHEAFEIFADWCDRWADDTNDPDTYAADWSRMHGPFRRGASWLYEKADSLSDGRFRQVEVWFNPVPTETNVFEQRAAIERAENPEGHGVSLFPMLRISDILNRPPAVFLIKEFIPQDAVGFLYGHPGSKKSFIAIDIAMSIVQGFPDWHGRQIHPTGDGSVIYIAAEGASGLRQRLKAWLQVRGVEDFRDDRMFIIDQTVNFRKPEDVTKLIRSARALSTCPALIVVDTVSRAIPGADENGQADMSLFAEACKQVKEAFGCAVLGVHHSNKKGDAMRGSSVLEGAADFKLMAASEPGSMSGTLKVEKQKDGPDGKQYQYQMRRHFLEGEAPDEDGEMPSSLVLDDLGNTAVSAVTETGPEVGMRVLERMKADYEAGRGWLYANNGADKNRRYPYIMNREFGINADRAKEMVKGWRAEGIVVVGTTPGQRAKVLVPQFLPVDTATAFADQGEGVFG